MKIKILRYSFLIAAIMIMVLIFMLSAEPAEVSDKTSGTFIEKIASSISSSFREMDSQEKSDFISSVQHFVRKLAHFIIYLLLGFFIAGFFSTFQRVGFLYIWLYSQLSASLYAISDELHQTFVNGRSGQISDCLLDSIGALVGIVFVIAFLVVIFKKRNFVKS